MNDDEDCWKIWNANDWKLTRSVDSPMGPVFDERWEGKHFVTRER